jgi:hypothetical protein
MALTTSPHFEAADAFYEALIDAHRDLSAAQSHELNAKLVLLLANHVGERAALTEALEAARASVLHAGASKDGSVSHAGASKDASVLHADSTTKDST